jgi:hypothetical protein
VVKTRTPEQTEHNKRMALKRYWYRQYGIAIQNDEQYDFFKRNRILILKTMPLLDQINDLQFHQTVYDDGEGDADGEIEAELERCTWFNLFCFKKN